MIYRAAAGRGAFTETPGDTLRVSSFTSERINFPNNVFLAGKIRSSMIEFFFPLRSKM
jgi:hypothetical protein